MKNFWEKLGKPFFAMAPMAGYTDMPFRIMCKSFGADVLVSEMVSSQALFHNAIKLKIKNAKFKINEKQNSNLYKTLKLIQFSKIERPYVVQIFGSDPEKMAFAAEYITTGEWTRDYLKIKNLKLKIEEIPDGIDINMGCPAKDVVKTGSGVALMKDINKAQNIVRSVKGKVGNMPVSVKTRLGWAKNDEILEFSKHMENAGADAITVHGRTYKGGFSAPVDWDIIKQVKKQLSIPVIGNGSIDENFKFQISNLKLNLDGYMIGRGALGKPWIFRKLKSQSEECEINESLHDDYINRKKLVQIILEHAKLVDKYKGKWGIKEFRKHFAWYLKGVEDGKVLREQAVRVETLDDIRKICDNMV